MRGLKAWTRWRAKRARFTRRISSSVLPLNIEPVMTSTVPTCRGIQGEAGVATGGGESAFSGRQARGRHWWRTLEERALYATDALGKPRALAPLFGGAQRKNAETARQPRRSR